MLYYSRVPTYNDYQETWYYVHEGHLFVQRAFFVVVLLQYSVSRLKKTTSLFAMPLITKWASTFKFLAAHYRNKIKFLH